MLWVLLFVGIALAGLVMLIGYAVWLAHKTADVLSEVQMLGERGAQLADLLAEIRMPGPAMPAGGSKAPVPGPSDVR
ncbi:MAG: hypothetical protein ACJ72G_10190 [Friedmanniella sp.]